MSSTPTNALPVVSELEGRATVAVLALLNGTTTWTPAERTAFDAKVATRKKADEEKRLRLAEAARQEAVARFGPAGSADPRHAYLVKKQIKPHGIRQAGSELLVPRRDMRTGELVDLQRILPDGTKLNLENGRVDDTWFASATSPTRGTVLLGEGFATSATGFEVTGHPTIVCVRSPASSRPRPSSYGSSTRRRESSFWRTTTGRSRGTPA